MTYRITIEATAEREIRAIVRWKTRNASPTVAARWYNGLLKKVGTLRTHPTRCPIAAENDKFPIEIKGSECGSFGHRFGFGLAKTEVTRLRRRLALPGRCQETALG
jgi:hypothetical protein